MVNEQAFLTNLIEEDDVSWQATLHELVNSEQMDPWDVDITILTGKFLDFIKQMKETNLKISGKIILAAAILLRLKSGRFIDFDLTNLENLMNSSEEYAEFDEAGNPIYNKANPNDFKIFPRTPQARKRKVSIYDLIGALEKMLESQQKKVNAIIPLKPLPPMNLKHADINLVIQDVQKRLFAHCDANNTDKLKFSNIVPSDRKEDVISTFVPLLHLTNQRLTDLNQEVAFNDFDIHVLKRNV
jgi:segregation and condensation protein A